MTEPEDPWEGDELRQRVRKIKPQLSEGNLVRVIGASNQAEGEMIQGMLLEEGVPSMLSRARGSDVPDFLAAGRRDVLVPASGLTTAREVLLQAEMLSDQPEATRPGRLFAGLLLAVAIVALVLWVGTELLT
jgi:hypothetical protein